MILDHAILGLLNRGPLTGYELKKAFDRSIQHFWTADQSHIYRVLTRLAKQGFVTYESIPQDGKPNRKVYHMTSAGREELVRWLASKESRAEVVRNPFLVHLFFSSLVSDERNLEVLRQDRKQSERSLATLNDLSERSLARASEKPSRERFFWYLTVDYGLWMGRAHLEWLDKTIGRIERGDPDHEDWSRQFPSSEDVRNEHAP